MKYHPGVQQSDLVSLTVNASGNGTTALGEVAGLLRGVAVVNNNQTNNNWDLAIATEDNISVYTNTSVSSNDGLLIPAKDDNGGATPQTQLIPIAGNLSAHVRGASANSTPKVRLYWQV